MPGTRANRPARLDKFPPRPYNMPRAVGLWRPCCSVRGGRPARELFRMSDQDSTERILRAIRRILRRTSEHSRQVSRDSGLSVPQSLCLRAIGSAKKGEEVTVVGVARAIQLSPATVSRLLDKLEVAELIVRERTSHDRRKVCLRLTPLGRQRLKKLPPLLQQEFTARLEALPARKQSELLRALETTVELMEAVELDASPVLDTKHGID